MVYTVEPGKILRKRFEAGRFGDTLEQTHAFEITDIERFVLASWLRAERAGHQALADRVLKVGLDWEHLLANLDPDPLQRGSLNLGKLEELAEQTEILAGEIDVRTGAVDAEGNPFPPVREEKGGEK